MVDKERVCCLCGDVGFPQQLFRCSRCRFRFQHSYCSNYYKYGNEAEPKAKDNKCDWCQYESGKNPSSPWSSSSTYKKVHAGTSSASKRPLSSSSESYNYNHDHIRSEYTTGSGGPRIIKMVHDNNGNNNNDSTNINVMENPSSKPPPKYNSTPNSSGVPSPRPNGHRRYKLLKDVMC